MAKDIKTRVDKGIIDITMLEEVESFLGNEE
jgi:hypothetical protein